MEPFNKIESYCTIMCEQIRWKKARGVVEQEIKCHLLDQRDAYMFDGDDESIATDKAIVQMGDPVSIGEDLDKTHKPKPQWTLLILTGVLIFLGIMFNSYVRSPNASVSLGFRSPLYILSFVILISCYFIDFTFLGKNAKKIYAVLLVLTFISIVFSIDVNGKKYLYFNGFIGISLSYFYLLYSLSFALMVYTFRNKGFLGIIYCGLVYLPFAIFLLIINTNAGLIMYTLCSLIILTFSILKDWFNTNNTLGNKGKLLALGLVWIPVMLGVIYVFGILGFRSQRIHVLLDPYSNQMGAGYLYCVTRELIKNSLWIGKANPIDMEYSKELLVDSDLMLTYLISQFGLIILFIVALLVGMFILISIKKVLSEKSVQGSIVALTISILFSLQVIFYIMANLGYGLILDVTMPFVSYSGTSLFINAMFVGFMLSVFRTGDVVRDSLIENKPSSQTQLKIFNYKINLSIEKMNN